MSYIVSILSIFFVVVFDWLLFSNYINREKGKVGKIDLGVYDVLLFEVG